LAEYARLVGSQNVIRASCHCGLICLDIEVAPSEERVGRLSDINSAFRVERAIERPKGLVCRCLGVVDARFNDDIGDTLSDRAISACLRTRAPDWAPLDTFHPCNPAMRLPYHETAFHKRRKTLSSVFLMECGTSLARPLKRSRSLSVREGSGRAVDLRCRRSIHMVFRTEPL
jgi:hypothetical protein